MFLDKLNEALTSKKSFLADPINFFSIGISLALNIIHWVILYIKIKPTNQNILLHYNVIYGADHVGKSALIYSIPAAALVLGVINILIASNYYKKEKLAAYFLNIGAVAVQIIFLIASIVLIVANGQ